MLATIHNLPAPTNANDQNGATPTSFASHGGHTNVLAQLIAAGADVNLALEVRHAEPALVQQLGGVVCLVGVVVVGVA